MKMSQNGISLRPVYDGGECCRVRLLDGLQAAKMLQQSPGGERTDSGYVEQLGLAIAYLAPLAMEGHGETVRFIANQLHQVQHR